MFYDNLLQQLFVGNVSEASNVTEDIENTNQYDQLLSIIQNTKGKFENVLSTFSYNDINIMTL